MWKKKETKEVKPHGIEKGQKVSLKLGELKAVDGRIEEVGATHVVVGLVKEPDRPLNRLGKAKATLDTFGGGGAVRFTGIGTQHNKERDAVRVELDGKRGKVQRREFFRVDTITDVVISRESGQQIETHTLDLSAAGLLLPGPRDLKKGERLWVSIDVGESTPIRARGHVARITEENHKGVRFDLIDEGARDRLVRFLFKREQQARRAKAS